MRKELTRNAVLHISLISPTSFHSHSKIKLQSPPIVQNSQKDQRQQKEIVLKHFLEIRSEL